MVNFFKSFFPKMFGSKSSGSNKFTGSLELDGYFNTALGALQNMSTTSGMDSDFYLLVSNIENGFMELRKSGRSSESLNLINSSIEDLNINYLSNQYLNIFKECYNEILKLI
jgi:hypothetical protein